MRVAGILYELMHAKAILAGKVTKHWHPGMLKLRMGCGEEDIHKRWQFVACNGRRRATGLDRTRQWCARFELYPSAAIILLSRRRDVNTPCTGTTRSQPRIRGHEVRHA